MRVSRATNAGTAPGTLRAPKDATPTRIDILAYSETDFAENMNVAPDGIAQFRDKYPVLWVNVTGFADIAAIEKIGEEFKLHRLALEDVLHVHQRPKVEEFDDHLFIIIRKAVEGRHIDTEQIAIFLGTDFVITFQEFPAKGQDKHSLDTISRQIRDGVGRLRRSGADFLCYRIVDSLIDGYFPILENLGDRLESLEDRIVSKPDRRQVRQLHNLKRDLLVLRRAIWPQREMINKIIRDEHALFTKTTALYLRDAYDHTAQLMDIVETYREIASGLLDVYLSSISTRMNEIMKVLTIIATIFMPLGFIASLYGMNFDRHSPWNMPELGWRYGYLFALFLMVSSAGGMLWYFHRKKWIDLPWLRR